MIYFIYYLFIKVAETLSITERIGICIQYSDLTTGWISKELIDSQQGRGIYLFSKVSGSAKGAHPASYTMGSWGKVAGAQS
jgi:hypothetical protein